ncbi:hypothetical protein C8R45DRAFT_1209425 [Mycena sanguinolenta]|nr:hypothetical protein C8R45DRAFT_1209425 [Mycena sanguinolenta]
MLTATFTLQNALNHSSPVTLHFEDSDFDISCPHPPTSSLKGGVLVRSRPSSMEISEHDLPAEFGHAESHGICPGGDNTSATRATTPLCIVHRALDEAEENSDEVIPPTAADANASAIYRRTWPSMEVLRRRISAIFHRKDASYVPRAPSPTASNKYLANATPPLASRRLPVLGMLETQTPVINAARAQRVRRSRSFAGFTHMALQVLDPIPEPDVELDEVGWRRTILRARLGSSGFTRRTEELRRNF